MRGSSYIENIDGDRKPIYIYIKNISRFFNLSTPRNEKGQRFGHICSQKQAPLKAYDAHICKCYKSAKESTCIKFPDEDTFMKFKKLQNMVERPFSVYVDTERSLLTTNDANKVVNLLIILHASILYAPTTTPRTKGVRVSARITCMR